MRNYPLPGKDWRIVQGFGENPKVYKKFGLKAHNGEDYAPPKPGQKGVMVYAPHDGYISIPPFEAKGYGNHVIITSLPYDYEGTTEVSTLAHFAKLFVKKGQFVYQGDRIGEMGDTGFSSGIHLHWTYKKGRGGVTLNKNNGYLGAIDISPYLCHWELPA